jgi:hypothetical protein
LKAFFCACGHRVFFDNTVCLRCGRELGFDPDSLSLTSLAIGDGDVLEDQTGRQLGRCRNQIEYHNCNWLVPASGAGLRCRSCELTEITPPLERGDNLMLWTRLERAKRRLLCTLLSLGLPVYESERAPGLRFRFLEDQTRNPDVLQKHVLTGHADGVITVNLAEADDSTRHARRDQLHERYRTVLGHLRHEVGLFGDERIEYDAALGSYYESGPDPHWELEYVSAYASAHPSEDFAETFAHYLHIRDALETAEAAGLAGGGVGWLDRWIDLAITLNELNRSLGADDAYPFVLTGAVRHKLELIDRLVRRRA